MPRPRAARVLEAQSCSATWRPACGAVGVMVQNHPRRLISATAGSLRPSGSAGWPPEAGGRFLSVSFHQETCDSLPHKGPGAAGHWVPTSSASGVGRVVTHTRDRLSSTRTPTEESRTIAYTLLFLLLWNGQLLVSTGEGRPRRPSAAPTLFLALGPAAGAPPTLSTNIFCTFTNLIWAWANHLDSQEIPPRARRSATSW
jgi:hypothetical protein